MLDEGFMILLMRGNPLFIHKIYRLLAKNGRHILYTWPLYIRPTQENKILTITTLHNGLFFIYGRHTHYFLYDFYNWLFTADNTTKIKTITFYIWLIFSQHKILTKYKILFFYIRFERLVWHYLLLDILNIYGRGIFFQ